MSLRVCFGVVVQDMACFIPGCGREVVKHACNRHSFVQHVKVLIDMLFITEYNTEDTLVKPKLSTFVLTRSMCVLKAVLFKLLMAVMKIRSQWISSNRSYVS